MISLFSLDWSKGKWKRERLASIPSITGLSREDCPLNQYIDSHISIMFWWWKSIMKSLSCFWHTYPSERYDLVNWDDEIPNIHGIKKNKHIPITTYLKMLGTFLDFNQPSIVYKCLESSYLFGGLNPSEKYESQLGWLNPQLKWFQSPPSSYWWP